MSPCTDGKVVILDRDGTMVADRQYLDDPDGLEFLPGAAEGLRRLCRLGCRLVVITNQSGVGRGLIALDRLLEINLRLMQAVNRMGARIEGVYFCPHVPEAGCDCRKPRPKLMIDAARELGFEPSKAVVIGDKPSDVEFGRRLGATTLLIAQSPLAGENWPAAPDYIVRDLVHSAHVIENL